MEIANGRYLLVRRLGEGGTGIVYQGIDRTLGRPVAVKALHPTVDFDLLRREAGALALLNHPSVVAVYDLVEEDRVPYLVLEFVDGCDLEQWLSRRGPLSVDQALTIVWTIASALMQAHSRGLVHCDLKPANLLISTSGTVKLTDFTLARRHTSQGFRGPRGTSAAYAAPEQWNDGDVTPRTDVYALGAVLQRLLVGANLTVREEEEIRSVVDRSMAVVASDRFADIGEFMSALPPGEGSATLLASMSPLAELTRIVPTRSRSIPRPVTWRLAAIGTGLLLAATGIFTRLTVFAGPERIAVPELVATQQSSAQLVARSLALQPFIVRRYSSAVSAGTVMQQQPVPGSHVERRSTVTLVVSAGPAPVSVPALIGLQASDSSSRLRTLGFRVTLQTETTLTHGSGEVLSQVPEAGQIRVPGTTVTLTVSQKPWWWPF